MLRKIWLFLQIILMLPLFPVFGAIKVKSVDQSTTKWKERARGAAAEYAANALAAAGDWATQTAAAADTFGMAIAAAGIKERFRRGVVKAGAAKYARKVESVGGDRFGPGVDAADADYKTGVEPYFSTLAALTLPGRKPKGDPANIRRVETVTTALHAKRLALLGGS